jgi:hypothetical protein
VVIMFKLFGIAIALVVILYLIANAFRSVRKLDRRITEFKADQEEAAKQGKVIHPYAALAELYSDSAAADADARCRKSR